ncbi:hypothetical protein ACFQRC_00005, partial [Enterovirga sp. GCM10030262]|uniref:hypothetical protein n=1 Tax=Enterovirga sp. GCM10030262 TaxID=3273391 RepID=UPI003606E789
FPALYLIRGVAALFFIHRGRFTWSRDVRNGSFSDIAPQPTQNVRNGWKADVLDDGSGVRI